jgi:hypothetical protein
LLINPLLEITPFFKYTFIAVKYDQLWLVIELIP